MNWLYYIRNKSQVKAKDIYLLQLYLRAYMYDAEKYLLVSEKVVSIDILAVDEVLERHKTDPEVTKFYFEKLSDTGYFIEYGELAEDEDLFMAEIALYLATSTFTMAEALDWVKKIFVIKSYPHERFKEGTFEEFSDTDPFLRMFSLKNVQKFEGKFGKEWWKGGDKNKDLNKDINKEVNKSKDKNKGKNKGKK